MSGLSNYSSTEILAELQRRIHCRGKAESRTILVGPPGERKDLVRSSRDVTSVFPCRVTVRPSMRV
jgi:hypothetical protein